jgi:hypothetical protein
MNKFPDFMNLESLLCVEKSLMDSILSQLNIIHTLASYLSMTHVNIIFKPIPIPSRGI